MEKQPVDDLFSRKLRDAEIPVRADMFSEMQKRIGAKPLPVQRSVAGWWSVVGAACALLVIWFLYSSDKAHLPGIITTPIVSDQKPEKGEPIATRQTGHSTNVPEPVKPANRQTYKRAEYRNQVAQTGNRSQKQARPAVQLPAQQQASTPMPRSMDPVAVIPSPTTQQVLQSPATMASIPIERVIDKRKPTVERTIILNIDEPQMTTALATKGNDLLTPLGSPMHQSGLSGLFGKLKQLKNGEVLAKVTIAPGQTNQQNRFGRVFTEVKESLKNETTLD
jgi:hypothetical protein